MTSRPRGAARGRRAGISCFYDRRVADETDLNTRIARGKPAHHHSGIVRSDASIPEDEPAAVAWLYRAEEALCDLVWHVLCGTSPREPVRLLDAGCGEGASAARWVELARPRRLQIHGITLSPRQAEAARANVPGGIFLCGDMLDPAAFAGGGFDAVVAIESTEYLGRDGLPPFFRRAHDWLAPGGCLVVVAGCWVGPPSRELSAAVAAFDEHYLTTLSSTDDYLAGGRAAGLRLAADIDLSAVALNYWRARIERRSFWNSPAARVERVIAEALSTRIGEFRLYGWVA
jgi:SAM-dependent methyltransferase